MNQFWLPVPGEDGQPPFPGFQDVTTVSPAYVFALNETMSGHPFGLDLE